MGLARHTNTNPGRSLPRRVGMFAAAMLVCVGSVSTIERAAAWAPREGVYRPDDRPFSQIATAAATAVVPGGGFGGAWSSQQIGLNGNPGGNATAIARQVFANYRDADEVTAGEFYFGVIADHVNGIAKVECSIEGGTRAVATGFSLNPRTNLYEYGFKVALSAFGSEGMKEVRFEVFPANDGLTRVIVAYLWFDPAGTYTRTIRYVDPVGGNDSNNGQTSGAPWKTIKPLVDEGAGDGYEVRLLSAGFQLEAFVVGFCNNSRPVRIRPDDGLAAADVEWAQSQTTYRIRRVEVVGCNIDILDAAAISVASNVIGGTFDAGKHISFRGNCRIASSFTPDPVAAWTGWIDRTNYDDTQGPFAIDCTIRDMPSKNNCPNQVNCTIFNNAEDSFIDPELLYGCTATDTRTIGEGHDDLVQWNTDGDKNSLVWNVLGFGGAGQGVFSDKSISNVSVANVAVRITDASALGGATSQFGKDGADVAVTHLLVRNCSLPNHPFVLNWSADAPTHNNVYTDCLVQGVGCKNFLAPDDQGITFADNMCYGTKSYQGGGTPSWDAEVTQVVAVEADLWTAEDDLAPAIGSPLLAACARSIPFGYGSLLRDSTTAIGAYAGASEVGEESPPPPDAPDLMAAQAMSPTSVRFMWSSVAGAQSYDLEWSTDAGFAGSTTVAGLAVTSWRVEGLTPQTTYYGRVTVTTATGTSDPSGSASATTPAQSGLDPRGRGRGRGRR